MMEDCIMPKGNKDDSRNSLTAQKLLDCYRTFGIPHFQRGMVWKSESVGLLLESLFYDTPCGTIILWKPESPEREGIPLPEAQEIPEYLIIDGQQRIRSIYSALHDLPTEVDNGDTEYENGNPDGIWCLNLTKINELADCLDPGLQSRPLFMKVRDPRDPKARFRYNLVPLKMFFKKQDESVHWSLFKKKGANCDPEMRFRKYSSKLREHVNAIFHRKLFLVVKNEREGENGLAPMVALYNRINSSGVRIEKEEKAFASLVSVWPGTNEWIRDTYENIHGQPKNIIEPDRLERDDVLRRKRERNFGFKFIMRSAVLSCGHHFGYSAGSSSLSFNVINSDHMIRTVGRDESRLPFCELMYDTSGALSILRKVLDRGCYCDDLRFLPDTYSLLPALQLMIKYPELTNEDNGHLFPLIALFASTFMMKSVSQKEWLDVIQEVRKSNRLSECRDLILVKSEYAEKGWKGLVQRLESSNSVLDRYVLMLYWLERKNKARDFSYENVAEKQKKREKIKLVPGQEKRIERACDPEKQHLVPFSEIDKVYGHGRRSGSHPINNIGNITYISHDLNYFGGGLSADPLCFSLDESPNLEAHFISDSVKSQYETTLVAIDRKSPSEAKTAYENFCKERRKLIADGFRNWIRELREEVKQLSSDRMEPKGRLFQPSYEDRVRDFDYDNAVEDKLIALLRKKDKQIAFVFELADKGPVRKNPSAKIVLTLRPSEIFLKLKNSRYKYFADKLSQVLAEYAKDDALKKAAGKHLDGPPEVQIGQSFRISGESIEVPQTVLLLEVLTNSDLA